MGPLVAGSCFALGYGITQRIVMLRQGQQDTQQASFQQSSFPGQSLDSLRRLYGADQPLMGDVTAKEARDAEKRKINGEAEAIAAEAERRETQQQAAVREPAESLPARDLTPEPAPVLPVTAESLQDPASVTLPAAVETMAPDAGTRSLQRLNLQFRCQTLASRLVLCRTLRFKRIQGRPSCCPCQNPSAHRKPHLIRRTSSVRRLRHQPLDGSRVSALGSATVSSPNQWP